MNLEEEPSTDEIKKKSEEMVIKFMPEEDKDNSLSGLSRSIGKLWDAKSMVDVWETNNQELEENSPEFFIEELYKSEVEKDTDQQVANENDDDMLESSEGFDREAMMEEVRTILRRSQELKQGGG